jgi:hypothetical protein
MFCGKSYLLFKKNFAAYFAYVKKEFFLFENEKLLLLCFFNAWAGEKKIFCQIIGCEGAHNTKHSETSHLKFINLTSECE